MGSFDGAETCELVGAYLLSQLPTEYGNDIRLYRDDGLAAFHKPPRDIENIKKQICKVFSDNNLKITIEANKKCVNYLDITLDLRSSSYKPFMKPGNAPVYVTYNSNHPPSILRGIPDAINKRLSNISSDKRSFDSAAPPYQEALRKSGFDYNLSYIPSNQNQNATEVGMLHGLIHPTVPMLLQILVANFFKLSTNAFRQPTACIRFSIKIH